VNGIGNMWEIGQEVISEDCGKFSRETIIKINKSGNVVTKGYSKYNQFKVVNTIYNKNGIQRVDIECNRKKIRPICLSDFYLYYYEKHENEFILFLRKYISKNWGFI